MVDYLNASNVVEQRRRAAREAGGHGPRTIVRRCSVLQIFASPCACPQVVLCFNSLRLHLSCKQPHALYPDSQECMTCMFCISLSAQASLLPPRVRENGSKVQAEHTCA